MSEIDTSPVSLPCIFWSQLPWFGTTTLSLITRWMTPANSPSFSLFLLDFWKIQIFRHSIRKLPIYVLPGMVQLECRCKRTSTATFFTFAKCNTKFLNVVRWNGKRSGVITSINGHNHVIRWQQQISPAVPLQLQTLPHDHTVSFPILTVAGRVRGDQRLAS